MPRRTPHSQSRSFTEPVRLPRPLEEFPFAVPTSGPPRAEPGVPVNPAFEAAAARARDSPAWRYHEIATNHLVPQNRPAELAGLLLDLA